MKYLSVVMAAVFVLFLGLVTTAEADINEGFDNFDTGVRPIGWTFDGCKSNSNGYTVAGYYGVASPSIILKLTGNAITTCPFGGSIGNLSFWVRSLGTNPSSSLLVEEMTGDWSTVTNIVGIPDASAWSPTLALNASTSQVRFTFTRVGDWRAYIVVDDVSITGAVTPTPTPLPVLAPTPIHLVVAWDDYNGDTYSDYALFRSGTWDIMGAQAETVITEGVVWGDQSGDIPAPGDYDGDGTADLAYFNRISAKWNVKKVDGTAIATDYAFGSYGDIPAPEDYDGDGTTDYATIGASGGLLYWNIDGQGSKAYGVDGEVPIPGDYDGDGTADKAVLRTVGGLLQWVYRSSATGSSVAFSWGYPTAGDQPLAFDYNGDGVTDALIRRTYSATKVYWFPRSFSKVRQTSPDASDIPVVGDFDSDGEYNFGVFRGDDGTWYIYDKYGPSIFGPAYGQDGDLPVVGQTF